MSRTRLSIAIIALLGTGLALYLVATPWQSRPSPATAEPNATVVNIPVEGMSCASCVASVKKAVSSIDGVTAVDVSLEHRQAKVRYVPDKASAQQIAGAINKLGYKAGEPKIEEAK